MKKILSLILALVTALALVACGAAESGGEEPAPAGENEIAQLLAEGYTCTMSTGEEGKWKGIFQKEDDAQAIVKVVAAMSAEEYAEYEAIDWADEEAEAKTNAVLTKLSDVQVTNVSEMIPTQEELDAYIGMTLGDLELDGFENTGNTNYEGVYSFFYDGPVYCCTVDLAEGTIIEDMDNYSANDLRELVIGKVEYTGISSYILDD